MSKKEEEDDSKDLEVFKKWIGGSFDDISTRSDELNKMFEERQKPAEGFEVGEEKRDIAQASIDRIQQGKWLNDEGINVFIYIVLSESKTDRLFAVNSHWIFSEKVNETFFKTIPLSTEIMFLPVNKGNYHWVLIVVDIGSRKMYCFDSMGSTKSLPVFFIRTCSALGDALTKRFGSTDLPWTQGWMSQKAIQKDSDDCGVFCAMFVKRIVALLDEGKPLEKACSEIQASCEAKMNKELQVEWRNEVYFDIMRKIQKA